MKFITKSNYLRIILIYILSVVTFSLSAQLEEKKALTETSKHSIGINLQYDPNFGLMMGGNYHYSLSERWTAFAGVATNPIGSYSLRAGVMYTLLDYDFLKLHTGIGLNARRSNIHNYRDDPEYRLPWLWDLEFPFQLEVPLSEKWSLTSGISLRMPINEARFQDGTTLPYNGGWGPLRLGAKYRF